MFQKLKEALRSYRDSKPQYRRLRMSSDGVCLFSTKSARELWSFRWDELEEIVAYKVDAYVVDRICLGFRVIATDTFHVIDEDTPGWEELNETLTRRLGIEQSTWFHEVAFPPFAENWMRVWKRAA